MLILADINSLCCLFHIIYVKNLTYVTAFAGIRICRVFQEMLGFPLYMRNIISIKTDENIAVRNENAGKWDCSSLIAKVIVVSLF